RCVIHSAASRLTFWVRGAAHYFCRVRLNPVVSQSLTFTCIADRQEKTFALTEFLTRSAFWAGLLDCRRGLIRSRGPPRRDRLDRETPLETRCFYCSGPM